jgi:ABC-type nitrate/sulfonate/bicarbonate transport system substrate-binding protein
MRRVRVGYIPLSDAAVLIAAAERGFAQAQGLELVLEKEASWANIRDKLVFGHFEAAHMLAPLAIATSLGLAHVALPLVAPFALNLNGNAVTVSAALAAQIDAVREADDARSAANALARVIAAREASGAPPLTFGTTFPFSTHTYQLRLLLEAGGIDPDTQVRLVVVPPPFMVDALRRGLLDGFCVGSPWNSLAVEEGSGRILVLGCEIAERCPEKVIALPADADADLVLPLLRALDAAARWCAELQNGKEVARLLAAPRHLGLDPELILRTIQGRLVTAPGGLVRSNAAFLRLGGEGVNRPETGHARWLHGRMVEAGHAPAASLDAALKVYRPDLYDRALGTAGADEDGDVGVML